MSYKNLEATNANEILDSIDAKKTFLRFKDTNTPFIIAKPDYNDGRIHWVALPDGAKIPVVCYDSEKGFSPANCKICSWQADGYAKCRNMAKDDRVAADNERKKYNEVRTQFSSKLVIVKGSYKESTNKQGQISSKPTFENAEVGICDLNEKQTVAIFGLVENEDFPFIQHTRDLIGRVMIMSKKAGDKKTNQKFPPVDWSCVPFESKTDIHTKLGVKWESFDIKDAYTPNSENTERAYTILTGGSLPITKLALEEEDGPTKDNLSSLDDTDDDLDLDEDDFEDDIPY